MEITLKSQTDQLLRNMKLSPRVHIATGSPYISPSTDWVHYFALTGWLDDIYFSLTIYQPSDWARENCPKVVKIDGVVTKNRRALKKFLHENSTLKFVTA
jgi:hypothetical protein